MAVERKEVYFKIAKKHNQTDENQSIHQNRPLTSEQSNADGDRAVINHNAPPLY